jgi:shikimate kinase
MKRVENGFLFLRQVLQLLKQQPREKPNIHAKCSTPMQHLRSETNRPYSVTETQSGSLEDALSKRRSIYKMQSCGHSNIIDLLVRYFTKFTVEVDFVLSETPTCQKEKSLLSVGGMTE